MKSARPEEETLKGSHWNVNILCNPSDVIVNDLVDDVAENKTHL